MLRRFAGSIAACRQMTFGGPSQARTWLGTSRICSNSFRRQSCTARAWLRSSPHARILTSRTFLSKPPTDPCASKPSSRVIFRRRSAWSSRIAGKSFSSVIRACGTTRCRCTGPSPKRLLASWCAFLRNAAKLTSPCRSSTTFGPCSNLVSRASRCAPFLIWPRVLIALMSMKIEPLATTAIPWP